MSANDYRNEWNQYRELVLAELKRQNLEIMQLQKELNLIKTEAAVQKIKISMAVFVGSAVVSGGIAMGYKIFLDV